MATTSIVDYLDSVGKPSDYASRATLAAKMGIANYSGTAAQNTQLLGKLQSAPLPSVSQTNSTFMAANPQYGYNGSANPTTVTPAMQTADQSGINLQNIGQSVQSLVQQVQEGKLTQAQAYQAALSQGIGGAREGGTTAQQQAAAQVKNLIYSTNRTSIPVTTSVTGSAGTSAKTTTVAPGGISTAQGGTIGGPNSTGGATGGAGNYPSTGNPSLDALLGQYSSLISGSIAQGFTVNPSLSITPATLNQFIQETSSQLDPRYRQILTNEMTNVNEGIKAAVTQYQNTQSQTVQDYQQSLGTLRDQSSMGGGGERALESGLTNSANRSLSSLDATAQLNIGNQLRAAGMEVGQGIPGGNGIPGVSAGNVSGGASNYGLNSYSLSIPSIYGRTLTNQGGDSVFAGGANQGNALNFGFDPSTYQYGTIPQSYSSDFSNLLNQTASNYQQGMAATGATNQPTTSPVASSPQITSTYGNTLPSTPSPSSSPGVAPGMVSVPGIGIVSKAQAATYGY